MIVHLLRGIFLTIQISTIFHLKFPHFSTWKMRLTKARYFCIPVEKDIFLYQFAYFPFFLLTYHSALHFFTNRFRGLQSQPPRLPRKTRLKIIQSPCLREILKNQQTSIMNSIFSQYPKVFKSAHKYSKALKSAQKCQNVPKCTKLYQTVPKFTISTKNY